MTDISDYFDGQVITVSEGTLKTVDLIYGVSFTLDDIYGEYFLHDETRAEATDLANRDDDEGLDELYETLSSELEELANRHGYTYGSLEGDGAHFVLAPLTKEELGVV